MRTRSERLLAVLAVAVVGSLLSPPVGRSLAAGPDCAAVAPALAALGLAGATHTATDGTSYTVWSGHVPSWDGIPLATDVTVPGTAGCGLPLVALNHGYGGSRTAYETNSPTGDGRWTWHWNNAWFAGRGYAVLTFTNRGFADSCGPASSSNGTRAGLPPACTEGGRHYWVSMDDMRYAVRDQQWLIGLLVDAGLVDPNRIAVGGGSLGGAMAWNATLLNDRVACGGTPWNPANAGSDPCAGRTAGVVPWTSPSGVPLHVAAAVPEFTWGTLTSLLTRNGRLSDGLNGAPADGSARSPIPIPVQAWVQALRTSTSVFFEPTGGSDRTSSWGAWFADLTQPVDTVTAASGTSLGSALANAFDQWADAKSATTPYLNFDSAVPVMQLQGMSDSVAVPWQAAQMWRRAKAYSSTYPIALVYADAGHQPSTNPADVLHSFATRANAFLDYELKGLGATPTFDVRVMPFRCRTPGLALTQVAASDLGHAQVGTATYSSSVPRTTRSTAAGREATALDPMGVWTCPAMTTQQDPGVASWQWRAGRTEMILGYPVVTLRVHATAADAELNTRLWDVAPNGRQILMSRGTYRLVVRPGTTDTSISFETSMVAWRLPSTDSLKLEVTGYDAPTYQADPIASTTSVDAVKLVLPRADLAAYGTAASISAVAGRGFSGQVMRFAEPSSGLAGNYHATVEWGDGTTSAATVSYAGYGWYSVTAGHTWAAAGTYPVSVALRSRAGVTYLADSAAAVSSR